MSEIGSGTVEKIICIWRFQRRAHSYHGASDAPQAQALRFPRYVRVFLQPRGYEIPSLGAAQVPRADEKLSPLCTEMLQVGAVSRLGGYFK